LGGGNEQTSGGQKTKPRLRGDYLNPDRMEHRDTSLEVFTFKSGLNVPTRNKAEECGPLMDKKEEEGGSRAIVVLEK